ncbi:MAG: DUF86 domain-containing protein [Acidobacteriota bacterium]|nr:DUF86 domain-containing protein [Acidobacteriota bacterium]
MTKENKVFLQHILDCIGKIESYLQNADYAKFQTNLMMIDAVVRNVEVIGEAANYLTRDFRSGNPQIEWRKIIATRNRIIHGYATVDLEIIWNITQSDLSNLKAEIEKILEKLS